MRWHSVRGRHLFREVNERGYDLPLASVTRHGGVEFRSDLEIEVWNPSSNTSHYKRTKPGDFVIGLRSFQSGIGYSNLEGLVSPAYTVLRPASPAMHGPFFRHLFKSDIYISRLENVAQGIRQGRTINTEDFYNIPVAVPPLVQQRAIADYLDTETSRIDTLITKKRRMGDLLQERWRAYTESVLSRFAPLPLKRYATKIGSGSTPRGGANVYVPSGPAFLRSQNITNGVVDLSDVVFIDRLAEDQLRRALVHPGDVLLNITGASIGRSAVMDRSDIRAYVSQHVCIVRPVPTVDARILWAELSSQSVQEQIVVAQVGGNREGLNFEQVGNLLVRIPPSEHSQAICKELADGFGAVERATETVRVQVELLAERRQALITSAVTGELPIPGG